MSDKKNQHPLVLFFSTGLDLILQCVHWVLERVLWVGFSAYNIFRACLVKLLSIIDVSVRIVVLMVYLITVPFEWFIDMCLTQIQKWRPNYQLVKTAVMLFLVLPLAVFGTIIHECRQQLGRLLAVIDRFINNITDTIKGLLDAIKPDDDIIGLQPINIDLWLDGLQIGFINDRLELIESAQTNSVFMALLKSEKEKEYKPTSKDDTHSWVSLCAFVVADGLNVCIQLFNVLFLDWVNIFLAAFDQRITGAENNLDRYQDNLAKVHNAFCDKLVWPNAWVDTWLKVLFCVPKALLALVQALIRGIHVGYQLALELIKIPLLFIGHLVLLIASVWDKHFPCHELISSNGYTLPFPAQTYEYKMTEFNRQHNDFGLSIDPSIGITIK